MLNKTSRRVPDFICTMYSLRNKSCILVHQKHLFESLGATEFFSDFSFVPKCKPAEEDDVLQLRRFLETQKNICVLTGAGISTESGIPDYRSTGVGLYARSTRRPVLYKEFCDSESTRRRYWARNYVGWPRFSTVKPNVTHSLLKLLEDEGRLKCIITQNVDNLHAKAGSRRVIELHGTAFKVMCLSCDHKICRFELQETFDKLNPNMNVTSKMIRPDGDVELTQEQVEEFKVPPCDNCGGIIKPDIIFFGDNVPRQTVDSVRYNVEHSDSLLILGSTLTTYSGYRIALQARDAGKPILVVNIGETRADNLASIKVEGRCGDVLSRVYPSFSKCK